MLVFGSFVPHNKPIFFVHSDGLLVKFWVFDRKLSQKVYTELFPAFTSFSPNCFKVAAIAKVLCNCDCEIKIEHAMPPPSWDKHSFPGVLDALNHRAELSTSVLPFFLLESWQNKVKILNSLVVFMLLSEVVAPNEVFCDSFAWWHQDPALSSLN